MPVENLTTSRQVLRRLGNGVLALGAVLGCLIALTPEPAQANITPPSCTIDASGSAETVLVGTEFTGIGKVVCTQRVSRIVATVDIDGAALGVNVCAPASSCPVATEATFPPPPIGPVCVTVTARANVTGAVITNPGGKDTATVCR